MKILVDRHHAGLYHSLQRLFEDRLGHYLWTPIGHEWWDEGYWRFGEGSGDDRLAQQYLVPGAWLTDDPEFPGRAIWGVSLEDARKMDWAVVMTTLQENQQGFKRFADEVGAKYVVQVGNSGQQIDWALDPLVINSSEVPILGRGVRVGQEFDSEGLFAYSPPTNRQHIASFVNCMPSMPVSCYGILEVARDVLEPEGFTFGVHGIDGPEGNIKPISRTAEIMRNSGWGWHDKQHGDGYGHVIHYWAAIGRPLIGHGTGASQAGGFHYRGRVAEVFWRDLETCIDLDKHSFDEAMQLIRDISADPPRHEAMCRAIRAVFDATTDWEADAEAVRGLLA